LKTVIDIANFNADASCLDSDKWLRWLKGGRRSDFYRWLTLYVELEKPVVLALTGATAADIAVHNPEAITLINEHLTIFQVLLRPFSHDAALLRSRSGFACNFRLGKMVLESLFDHVFPAFLPPEFMLTAEQSYFLAEEQVDATFINANRFQEDIQPRIPKHIYRLKCPLGQSMLCIPVDGDLTYAYLEALDEGNADQWTKAVSHMAADTLFLWRDAESTVFFPDGNRREERWLALEQDIKRRHLPLDLKCLSASGLGQQRSDQAYLSTYPLHSLMPWLGESRMQGYIHRLSMAEARLADMDIYALGLWLFAITSDVLSAVEKTPVPKIFQPLTSNEKMVETTLLRCDRGFEGAECLLMLENYLALDDGQPLVTSKEAWASKVQGRHQFLKALLTAGDLARLVKAII